LLLITNIFSNVLKELNFSYVVFTCMALLLSSVVSCNSRSKLQVTSPNLMEWFERLGVEMCTSDMSFSASMRLNKSSESFEWGSRSGMSGVLAQKSNLLSPRFWLVVHEIFKFKNHALK
jgi:hypothetical protein